MQISDQKPCVKCGGIERFSRGECKACAKVKTAAWAAANPEKERAYCKAWASKNKEARRINEQNRRGRKAAAGGKISKDLPAKLFALQKGRCACCKQPLGADYHLDHIVPLSRGGPNTDDNMQLLRPVCNMQKHALHPIDFMQRKGFLL